MQDKIIAFPLILWHDKSVKKFSKASKNDALENLSLTQKNAKNRHSSRIVSVAALTQHGGKCEENH